MVRSCEGVLARLEDLFWELHIPGHRVELLKGQVVLSPMPPLRHGRLVTRLVRMLDPACLADGGRADIGAERRRLPECPCRAGRPGRRPPRHSRTFRYHGPSTNETA